MSYFTVMLLLALSDYHLWAAKHITRLAAWIHDPAMLKYVKRRDSR